MNDPIYLEMRGGGQMLIEALEIRGVQRGDDGSSVLIAGEWCYVAMEYDEVCWLVNPGHETSEDE